MSMSVVFMIDKYKMFTHFLLFTQILINAEVYNGYNLNCTSTQTSYKCTTNTFYAFCKTHTDICPNDWACIDLHNGFLCRTHDIAKFGRQHKQTFPSTVRRKRAGGRCTEMLCQFGGLCRDEKCVCLKHYTGKYCEVQIDYCASNPCRHNVTCVSRIGGFTCVCTPNLVGKYCQTPVSYAVRTMKHPNFLFDPLQYADFNYYYIFHTEDMGTQPETEVDFGDGTILTKKHLIIALDDAFSTLIRYFPALINIKFNALKIYSFKHAYKEPKVYALKVRAWNKHQEVFNTDYEVRVISPRECSLEVELFDAAGDPEIPQIYYRCNAINVMSITWSNCTQVKLAHQWQLHKVKSFNDTLGESNLYNITKYQVLLQSPMLNIPPYTLDFGRYVVVVYIKMVKPQLRVKRRLLTWLVILRNSIVAHIDGGKQIWVHSKSTFYIDARLSYDPNYERDRQPALTFTWTCHPPSRFCKGYDVLNETSSVLLVHANVLETQLYTFKVWVNNGNDLEVTNYTGIAVQEVEVVDTVVAFYSIQCLRNCIGGFANPKYIMALRGICMYDIKAGLYYRNSWVVYPHYDKNFDRAMRLDRTEFSNDNAYMILYEEQMDNTAVYKFVFTGYSIGSTTVGEGQTSFAQLYITTYDVPDAPNSCTVYPTEGYGMLTSFTVTCIRSTRKEDEVLLYEVVQFANLEDRAGSGTLVGYGYNGTIRDITLGPGIRSNDYVTMLHISVTNNYGMFDSLDCNVTVFPVIYYLTHPQDVMKKFVHVGRGLTSPLNTLLSGGNYFQLVQQIISTSSTLNEFLESQDVDHEDVGLNNATVVLVKDLLLKYLYQVPIANLQMAKHVATALSKVVNLPSQSVNGIDIRIMKKIVEALEDRFNLYNEIVFKSDMDDIGILLVSIAGSVIQAHTFEPGVLQEDIKVHEDTNLFHLSNPNLINVSHVINRYMHLYMSYKIPNERTTLITGPKLSLMMKRASPKFLTVKSLSLAGHASIKLIFDRALFNKNSFYNLEMIVIEDSSNRYDRVDSTGFHFPLISMNLTNEVDGSQVEADVEIKFWPMEPSKLDVVNGSLPVRLFWQINERHIQVHRIIVPKGGKLLLKFFPIERNLKLKVAIKKDKRPTIADFWYNGITIPQKVEENAKDKGLSVFVDDEAQKENTFYYVGVLPHSDTLKELMKQVEEPILPYAFHYEDEENDEDEQTTIEQEDSNNYRRHIQYIKHLPDMPNPNNQTLPYSFVAHSVRCVTWNETKHDWNRNCNVKSSTSSSYVTCNCTGHSPVTASFQRVTVKYQKYKELKYSIAYHDNPLIPFVIVFTLILFIGLFKWAAAEDRNDRLRRTVCFLVDNYPQCEYCYLIIVSTGRKIKAGTTSNVTVELEGTRATSLPHVLKDWTRDVLTRGSQDWFVLKTMVPLGEIYCLHIWTDYSGSRPSWYCRKVVVHDIKEQQIWFFTVDRWFDPISGDGSMSYTIYQSTDENIFSISSEIKEEINREFDSGMHGWLSILRKHPYNSYTRKQRVAVAYMHMILIMLVLIMLNDLPLADSPHHQMHKDGSYKWQTCDLRQAIYAVIIVFPVHNFFVWLFRCTKPSSQWTESRLDRTLSRFNMDYANDAVWTESDTINIQDNIIIKGRPIPIKKEVSFVSDFYEPEGDRKMYSRWSMEKLLRRAGSDKVVPLRLPTSKIETDVDQERVTPSVEVEPSIYGQEVVTQSYCFSPGCIYVVWILLLLVTIPCVYVVVLYGVSYGWMFSLHFLTSFILALLCSIGIVEPLKLVALSVYLVLYNRREYAVEDRSDLVLALNPEFTVPDSLRSTIVNKINKLRESNMYQPLKEEQVHKVKRNRVASFLTRMVIADFMLMLLFLLVLLCMIDNVFDSLSYRHRQNIIGLLTSTNVSRTGALSAVNTEQDLVDYLKNTLISNVQHDAHEERTKFALKPSVDGMNYLVGVIRLRQVRKSPKACHVNLVQKWAARCIAMYDTQNYTIGWKDVIKLYSPSNIDQPWIYVDRRSRFTDRVLYYNETSYPAGSYIATLGSNKEHSLKSLDYLVDGKWFDILTTVVYIEFALYNPHMHYLSIVTIMAERAQQGTYYMHDNVEIVKLNPMQTYGQLFLLMFLLVMFAWLVWYIHKESRKYSQLIPKQALSSKWDMMKKLLLILSIASFSIYTNKILNLDYYHEKIAQNCKENYLDFQSVAFWNNCLLELIAFMLFLVILELCYIFRTFYKVTLAWTVVYRSLEAVRSFFFMLMILILAFAWFGYILYGSSSYNFQSFHDTFYTVCAFAHRNFKISRLGNIVNKVQISFLYCCLLVVTIVFLFRWLIAVIMIHSYSATKRNAHFELYRPVISNYTKKYFNSIDTSPNRKPFKRTVYLRNLEPRLRAIGWLFVDFYNRKMRRKQERQRHMAMDAIALDVLRKKFNFDKWVRQETILQKYQRKEQAKALTRTIIITNALKSKLEYLNAKIDQMIRKERYRKLELAK